MGLWDDWRNETNTNSIPNPLSRVNEFKKEQLDKTAVGKVEEKVGDFKSFNETLDGHMGAEEDENKDSITVPGFTKEELNKIKETAMRLLSPGFHEDYEVGAYLSSVANDDPKIEKLLVKWLKSQGVNFYQPEYRDYMSKKNKN